MYDFFQINLWRNTAVALFDVQKVQEIQINMNFSDIGASFYMLQICISNNNQKLLIGFFSINLLLNNEGLSQTGYYFTNIQTWC